MENEVLDPVLIGRRLEALRIACEKGTQEQFASQIGVSKNRYNNWAVGVGAIPVAQAIRVCEETGASLDYIYRGERGSLPSKLSASVKEAERAGAPSPSSPSKRTGK